MGDTGLSWVTGQGNSTYRVTGVKSYAATNGSMFGDYGDNRLTLITADPALRANRRLVVTAKLVERPYAPTNLSTTLDPEGLGLTGRAARSPLCSSGSSSSCALLLLGVYAMTRWSRWTTWMVFVPAVTLVTWLFFSHVVMLLPATL